MEINKDVYFHIDRLNENIHFLDDFFNKYSMNWTLVCKLFDTYPTAILDELSKKSIAKSIACENIEHLEIVKKNNKSIETWFLNYEGININNCLIDVDLTHNHENISNKSCLMILLDQERIGVNINKIQNNLTEFPLTKIGAYLNCSILPDFRLLKKWMDYNFSNLTLQSLGTSIAFTEVERYRDVGVNHFRIGELAFFGKDLVSKKKIKNMRSDVFESKKPISYNIISNFSQNKNN